MPSRTRTKWAALRRAGAVLPLVVLPLLVLPLLVLALAAGCGAPAKSPETTPAATARPPDAARPGFALEAQLVIYVRQPQASGLPLVWDIRKIALEQADGNQLTIPGTEVTLRTSAIDLGQKLVAVVEVPKGEYTGLTFFTRGVYLEDTRAAVSAEANFVTVTHPFSVVSGNAKTILMVAEFAPPGADRALFKFQPRIYVEDEPTAFKGKLVYVSNEMSSSVSVIDKALGRVVETVYVGNRPSAIGADLRRNRLYIADRGAGAIYEMDMISQHLLKATQIDYVDEPVHIEPVPSRDLLIVVNNGSDTIHLVDPFTLQVIETLAVGDGPVDAVYSQFWDLAFVVNSLDNSISVVDLDQHPAVVDTTLSVELRPSAVTIDDSMGWLYVANRGSYNLSVIKMETLAVERAVQVGIGAGDVVLDPYGRRLYLAMTEASEVLCVDPYTGVTNYEVRLPGRPGQLMFDLEDKKLYAAVPEANVVVVIDPITREIQNRIETGRQPSSMAIRF
jgi:YVTN family beta-propeller protein